MPLLGFFALFRLGDLFFGVFVPKKRGFNTKNAKISKFGVTFNPKKNYITLFTKTFVRGKGDYPGEKRPSIGKTFSLEVYRPPGVYLRGEFSKKKTPLEEICKEKFFFKPIHATTYPDDDLSWGLFRRFGTILGPPQPVFQRGPENFPGAPPGKPDSLQTLDMESFQLLGLVLNPPLRLGVSPNFSLPPSKTPGVGLKPS